MDGRNPAPLGNHGKPLFVGIYREIMIPGFLRWCEMDFVHPQYVHEIRMEAPKGQPVGLQFQRVSNASTLVGLKNTQPFRTQLAVAQKTGTRMEPGKWKHGPKPA